MPENRLLINQEQDHSYILLDKATYSIFSIQKTTYKTSDKAIILLEPCGEAYIKVNFRKNPEGNDDLTPVICDFIAKLNDEVLREIVSKETAAIKNLLLAQVFSKTSLLTEIAETDSYELDPAHIALSRE